MLKKIIINKKMKNNEIPTQEKKANKWSPPNLALVLSRLFQLLQLLIIYSILLITWPPGTKNDIWKVSEKTNQNSKQEKYEWGQPPNLWATPNLPFYFLAYFNFLNSSVLGLTFESHHHLVQETISGKL